MKSYFAGTDAERHRDILCKIGAKSALYSFYYSKDKEGEIFDKFQDNFQNIFIDSGGYSARIQGVEINVEDYANYLKKVVKRKRNSNTLIYANLDLFDTTKSLANQKYLEDQGLKPLPVYHAFEFFRGETDIFFEYLKKYDYIAVGGLAGSNMGRKQLHQFLDFVFKHTKDKVRVHGFGINSFGLLKKYPFYSVDSTTWLEGGRFRHVSYFNGSNGLRKSYGKQSKNTIEGHKCCVNDYRELDMENAKTILKIEKYITRLWETRGIKWK